MHAVGQRRPIALKSGPPAGLSSCREGTAGECEPQRDCKDCSDNDNGHSKAEMKTSNPMRGRWNGSITRVRPLFGQLLERDPSGADWLHRLLGCVRRNHCLADLHIQTNTILDWCAVPRAYHDRVLQQDIALAKSFEYDCQGNPNNEKQFACREMPAETVQSRKPRRGRVRATESNLRGRHGQSSVPHLANCKALNMGDRENQTVAREVDEGRLPEKFHLWSTPVAVPLYRTYDVLRQSSAAYKAL
jgi:hypothetical protein